MSSRPPSPEPPAPSPGGALARHEALFGDRLAAAVERVGAPVAVGLDPHLEQLPAGLRAHFEGLEGGAFRAAAGEAVEAFCAAAIDAVAGVVAAVKPQLAFFEQLGAPGWAALERTVERARDAGLLVIADGKRGDISSTAEAYGQAILAPDGPVGADALTVNPWMGLDTLEPYLPWCRQGAGLFVLVRTTNPGSALLQRRGDPSNAVVVAQALDLMGREVVGGSGMSSLGAVVGASAWREARALREIMPSAWFLVPGVGAQGGSLEQALAGRRPDGMGALVVASRSVLFPPGADVDPRPAIRLAARTLVESARAVLLS